MLVLMLNGRSSNFCFKLNYFIELYVHFSICKFIFLRINASEFFYFNLFADLVANNRLHVESSSRNEQVVKLV